MMKIKKNNQCKYHLNRIFPTSCHFAKFYKMYENHLVYERSSLIQIKPSVCGSDKKSKNVSVISLGVVDKNMYKKKIKSMESPHHDT